MALDGIYVEEKGELVFRRVPPPNDAEVARVARRIHRCVAGLMERRGLGPQADLDEADRLRRTEPLLAELYSASVSGRVATGQRAGSRLARVGAAADCKGTALPSSRRCAAVAGYSIHAGISVPAPDRVRLERLSLLPDGRLLYRLKRRWRDGTSHVIYEPMELVGQLAALVPPPRFNLTRYHGVLAPSAALRFLIVPESKAKGPLAHAGCPAKEQASTAAGESVNEKRKCRPRNYSWAVLLRRVFSIDVLACPRCGGRMRILAAINPPDAIRKILVCLGLPTRAPPIAPVIPDPDVAHSW